MYRLEISRTAHRQISKLPEQTQERIREAIAHLSEETHLHDSEKLTDGGGYRIRVGDHRIIYQSDVETKTVTIYRVMSGWDVYRA